MKFLATIILIAWSVIRCASDGPELFQHTWISNGMIFASADIPPCFFARWERKFPDSGNTNWFAADSADALLFNRNVVFSEYIVSSNVAWYRIRTIYVIGCPTFDVMETVTPCAKLYD